MTAYHFNANKKDNNMNHLPATVQITCTDTGRKQEGIVVSASRDGIRVNVGGVALNFRKQKNIYVANMAGMEFTFKL
jgi:hypothetical protein